MYIIYIQNTYSTYIYIYSQTCVVLRWRAFGVNKKNLFENAGKIQHLAERNLFDAKQKNKHFLFK